MMPPLRPLEGSISPLSVRLCPATGPKQGATVVVMETQTHKASGES